MQSLVISLLALCYAVAVDSAAMPKGTLALPLHRIVNQTAYGVEMKIGTPPQHMSVLVDTGSSFIGLQGADSNWCKLTYKPCEMYGGYNNLTSSTAIYKNATFYNGLINHGSGDYISDTLRVGGEEFPRIIFGMITDYGASYPAPSPNSGLMGLVPYCENSSCTKGPITTLQQKLLRRNFINSNVLSLYLGPEHEDAVGHLLYSAIDRAKQDGPAVTIPVIDPSSVIANRSPNFLNFSSVSLEQTKAIGSSQAQMQSRDSLKTSTREFKLATGAFALVDSGYPGFTLPKQAWDFVKDYFSIKGPSDETGAYSVDCKFREQQTDNATLLVGFKDDEIQIRIPFSRLVTQRAPGECVTLVDDCGNGKGCSFGDAFLRSAYTIFNFDDLTITLSNVKYTTEEDIVSA